MGVLPADTQRTRHPRVFSGNGGNGVAGDAELWCLFCCLRRYTRIEALHCCVVGIQRHLLHRKHQHIRASLLETEIYDLPDLNGLELMMAGGLSGVAGWLSTYPIDVIKTRIQAQSLSGSKRYAGLWDCGQKIVREEGWRVLWRGTAATILRAFPTNAVIFLGYSWTMRGMMLTAPSGVALAE